MIDLKNLNFNDFFKGMELLNADSKSKKISEIWQAFSEQLMKNPDIWLNAMQEGQAKQLEIMQQLQNKEVAVQPAKSDKRFQSEQWRDNPFFSFLMQNYLVNSDIFRQIVENTDLPEKDKGILRFAVGQYIDAVSPTNFPTTNPEVVEEAIKTGGESLAAGVKNIVEDMQSGMVKNTDLSAFTIGDNIATTEGKVIHQTPLMQLIEYTPKKPKVHKRPLLIVPPCINKYYILDLTEKKSFVKHLLENGHRVFLISWVNADEDLAKVTWDDYLRDGVMAAMEAVQAVGKQEKINLLGFCIGGTLLVGALAALAANDEHPAQSLTLMASMLDYSDTGEIGLFIDEESVAASEQKYAAGGLVDGRELARGFAALRPNDLIWPYVIGNYYQGKNPPPFDLLYWNADSTNLPGPMFAKYLRTCYLENQIGNGTAAMCGVPIAPAKIKAPVYAVACEKDHIVPWQTAYLSASLLGKNSRFVLAASGHIAGIVNPPANNKGWYMEKSGVLPKDPSQWKEKATRHEGSWWTDWLAWLKKNSGELTAAPKRLGNVRYAPMEDAPGSYVSMPRPPVGGGDMGGAPLAPDSPNTPA